MLELTESNLDYIFSLCEWPFSEWSKLPLSKDQIPDAARLLIPFETGENTVAFHPDKLREYYENIRYFLDQIAWLDQKTGVSFPMLRFLKNGSCWTTNILEVQKLYLLGVVTDQIIGTMVNGSFVVGKISNEQSIVDFYAVDMDGKSKHLERTIGGKKISE